MTRARTDRPPTPTDPRRRPVRFFAEDGALPPTASLELVAPSGIDTETFRRELRRALEALEAAAHRKRSRFVGARRVLAQKPTMRPTEKEPRRTLQPSGGFRRRNHALSDPRPSQGFLAIIPRLLGGSPRGHTRRDVPRWNLFAPRGARSPLRFVRLTPPRLASPHAWDVRRRHANVRSISVLARTASLAPSSSTSRDVTISFVFTERVSRTPAARPIGRACARRASSAGMSFP